MASAFKRHRIPEDLNCQDTLLSILRAYWPEFVAFPHDHPGVVAQLQKMRLLHEPALTKHAQPCTRCGCITYALDAPRCYRLKCVVCRQMVFPRAGNPTDLTATKRSN